MVQWGAKYKLKNFQDIEHSVLFSTEQTETQHDPFKKMQYLCLGLCDNLLPKYMRDIESVNIQKYKFELDKFLGLIPDEPKMPNYVTSEMYRLGNLVLAASKQLQVFSVRIRWCGTGGFTRDSNANLLRL